MKRFFLISLFLFLHTILIATIHTISLDGTGDFTEIQEGINASIDGDTVLVYPDTYYENINYNGKNITVASLYLTTQIDSFVRTTIIDGNQNGSVVKAINGENETAKLCGFTIQNGTGTTDYWDLNAGGGIYIYDSNISISSSIIQFNTAVWGAGINVFSHYNGSSEPTLKGCTIRYNHAYNLGGGINVGAFSQINFDQECLCDIYLNSAGEGNDISRWGTDSEPIHVYVDTFTVNNNDSFFFYDLVGSTIECQHAKVTPQNHDLYVSSFGDNNNSGLSEDEPLKNIYMTLIKIASDSLHPNTIHIAEGTYSPSSTCEKYPLNLRSYITLEGAGKEETILDGDELSCVFYDRDYQRNYTIRDMYVINGNNKNGGAIDFSQPRNAVIENVIFENNISPEGYGRSVIASSYLSAFILDSTSVLIKYVEIINNIGGKAINTGPFEYTRIENTIIKGNTPYYSSDDWQGGGLIIGGHSGYEDRALTVGNRQNALFVNCTIGNNTAPNSGEGVSISNGSNVGFYNCILYGDEPKEMFVDGRTRPNTVTFQNTLLEGGQWDITILGTNTLNWLDGNLDTNPLWEGIGEYPYYLSSNSPCIDAGTLDLPDSIEIPLYDLAGNPRIYGDMIDMGAYEWQGYGTDDDLPLPNGIISFRNSPNPFKEYTNITCSIRDVLEISKIKISIYNSKGQLIRTFSDNNFDFSPYTEIYWDGTDEQGKEVALGAYFYKLEYNCNVVVRKMVMLR